MLKEPSVAAIVPLMPASNDADALSGIPSKFLFVLYDSFTVVSFVGSVKLNPEKIPGPHTL